MNSKNFAITFVVAIVAAVGVYFVLPKPEQVIVEKRTERQLVGAAASTDHYNEEYFRNGLQANKYFGLGSVNASTTSSTAPTLQLGAGSHGIITVGTSTPAISTQAASTTAITANSMVFVQQTTTGPAGVTCNTTQATNTLVGVYNHATSSNDGFVITLGSIPSTNPACFEYWIVDRSTSNY